MPRLFVAIDLPSETMLELARLQPPQMPGLRSIPPEKMHLTLHFIGPAEIEPLVAALQAVTGSAFPLVIADVGRFPPRGTANVLWAGVRVTAELLQVHSAVGTAIAAAGYSVESRPYSPHITLARCTPQLARDAVDSFLSSHPQFELPPIDVTGFALYSSTTTSAGPEYRREHWFPLCGVE